MTVQAPEVPEIETFHVPINHQREWKTKQRALLQDDTASLWIKKALVGSLVMPPEMAVEECQRLLSILKSRAWSETVFKENQG